MRSKLLYLNGGFDLRMRGETPPHLRELLPEMTTWLLPLGTSADRIVLDCVPPRAYLDKLREAGLDIPDYVRENERCVGYQAAPWGWDSESVARLGALGASLDHPPIAIVRTVNSRSFSAELAGTLGVAVPNSTRCESKESLADAVERAGFPCVIKPDHGSAGMGFVHIRHGGDAAAETAARSIRHWPVVIEPWLTRLADVSIRFELAADRTVSDMRVARSLVTHKGSSYGTLWMPCDTRLEPYRAILESTAVDVARALSAQRYFGPVNIDGMVAIVDGRERLFPLLEINARQSMSAIGYAVQERIAPGRPFLMRTLGRTRAELEYLEETVAAQAADIMYDPRSRCGVIALTPPYCVRKGRRHPARRAILFMTARSADELRELDLRLTTVTCGERELAREMVLW